MVGSGLIWITEIIRRADGSVSDVRVDMDGLSALMSPESLLNIHKESPGRIPNIYELMLGPDDEEEDAPSAIEVSMDAEGTFHVDLIVSLADCRTAAEARAIAAHHRGHIDTTARIVKAGNSVGLGGLARDLKRMGVELGDEVRVLVLRG